MTEKDIPLVNEDSLIYGGTADSETEKPRVFSAATSDMLFRFSAVSYDKTEANQFQYRLEGYDEAWSPWTTASQKAYTNLSDGDYAFQVRSKNVYGELGSEDRFAFAILPPWYLSWWAYAVYGMLFSGFLFQARRWELKRVNKKHALQLKLVELSKLKELDQLKSQFFANGTLYYKSGDYKEALAYFERSLEASRKMHHPIGKARALNDLGMVYQQLGDARRAQTYYQESLKIRTEIGQREAQCTCLFNLGMLSMETEQPEKARDFFGEALSIAREVNAKPRISQAHQHLSCVYEELEDCTNALHHYKLFHEVNEEVSREQSNTRTQNLKTRLELDKSEKIAEVERLKNKTLNEKTMNLNAC